ncbi:MAG TPA: sigma-70 family RNA polymerase sigma factor [Polyangiaceae bacterium]
MSEPLVEEALRPLLAHARAAHPGVQVTDGDFFAHVRRHCEAPPAPDAAAQLYFALACVHGDSAALEAFEAQYAPLLVQSARRAKLADADAEEVAQQLRVFLLVGEGESPPKLVEYAGRGDLRGWLRVVAMRAALRVARRGAGAGGEGRSGDDDAVLAVRSTGDDPELGYLKAVYRTAFRAAFAAAITSLEGREKTLLRQHLVDGLTIDEIAPLYGVHRATAARWLEKARELLLTRVRHEFADRARVSDRELVSVLRLVESRLDITLRRLLA